MLKLGRQLSIYNTYLHILVSVLKPSAQVADKLSMSGTAMNVNAGVSSYHSFTHSSSHTPSPEHNIFACMCIYLYSFTGCIVFVDCKYRCQQQ